MSGAHRRARGRRAQRRGLAAEAEIGRLLQAEGWQVLGFRLRTAAGEIDLAAERDGLLLLVEVKARATLDDAASALRPRQCARLLSAGEALLAQHPDWGRAGIRYDLMLVDAAGTVRRIPDMLRYGDTL